MIHPTRINLLNLREKAQALSGSISILRAKRLALIREFIKITRPLLKSREDMRTLYGKALQELMIASGYEGDTTMESITVSTERNLDIEVIEKSIWGLRYKEVLFESPVRSLDERGYDFSSTTAHLEEAIYLFERLVESVLELVAYENKIKRIGDEIIRTTRKIRVLEERVLPDIRRKIKFILQYIGEREREEYFRLKRFKKMRQ